MNYYKEIKDLLINNEVYKKVKDYSKNRNDLNTYYEVGRLIVEVQGEEVSINQDNTIELIICKKDNKFILGYSSDSRIYSREYVLNQIII